MMIVDVSNGRLEIKLTGWDAFWAMKRHISVSLNHIKNVEVGPAPNLKRITRRAAGSRWPGHIIAGRFQVSGAWTFWNIRKGERVVVIDLEGENYSRLVLEVPDPEGLVEIVKRAMS
jgi:hypothetical protein